MLKLSLHTQCSYSADFAGDGVGNSSSPGTQNKPGRLADMPALYNVSIADLSPHRQGLMYLLEFDQPRLPRHFRTSKDPLLQVFQDWLAPL